MPLKKQIEYCLLVLPYIGNEVPASWFQSLNAMFIIFLGTTVASIWAKRKLQSKVSTSLFKMIIGLIIMGTGFLFMTAASMQHEASGASAMYWLVLLIYFTLLVNYVFLL